MLEQQAAFQLPRRQLARDEAQPVPGHDLPHDAAEVVVVGEVRELVDAPPQLPQPSLEEAVGAPVVRLEEQAAAGHLVDGHHRRRYAQCRRADEDHVVGRQFPALAFGEVQLIAVLDHGQVVAAGSQTLQDVLGHLENDIEIEIQSRPADVALEDVRQAAGPEAGRAAEGDAVAMLVLGDLLLELALDLQDLPGLVHQQAPGVGGGDALGAPLQQGHPVVLLQLPDPARDRRLGHAQALGGGGEAAGVGDGDQGAQQDQFHPPKIAAGAGPVHAPGAYDPCPTVV